MTDRIERHPNGVEKTLMTTETRELIDGEVKVVRSKSLVKDEFGGTKRVELSVPKKAGCGHTHVSETELGPPCAFCKKTLCNIPPEKDEHRIICSDRRCPRCGLVMCDDPDCKKTVKIKDQRTDAGIIRVVDLCRVCAPEIEKELRQEKIKRSCKEICRFLFLTNSGESNS